MEITQVKIFPVQEDKLKAFVSVVFDHCFMVNDIKVIQGKDGLFLSMPSRRKKTGEFKDVAHPLNNETRRMLEENVLREYRREVDDRTPRRPDRPMEANAGAPLEGHRPQRPPGESPSAATVSAGMAGGAGMAAGTVGMAASGVTASANSVSANSVSANSVSANSVSANSVSANSVSANSVSANSVSANSVSANPRVAAVAPHEKTLEEVQEIHLSDSFWSVS